MKHFIYIILLVSVAINSCAQTKEGKNPVGSLRTLSSEEEHVIVNKGTETPFSGKYDKFSENGTYVCKRCSAELYHSSDKFDSGCGWPSFDDEIEGAVNRIPDGFRTEITCTNCGAHLGHVFTSEGFTKKDTRHCVNSISLVFIPAGNSLITANDTAYFAGGCFWGVEYYMESEPGVISAESGYIGGDKKNPSYRDVSSHLTCHAEAVRIIFNPAQTSYKKLAMLFFEIHDPTQVNQQGPDIGNQYRSEIFYRNMNQKKTAEKLIAQLRQKGYKVATQVTPASTFWIAEDYHQNYYEHKGSTPYCHKYTKRF